MGLHMEKFPSTSSGILHGGAGASATLNLWEWEQLCEESSQEAEGPSAQCLALHPQLPHSTLNRKLCSGFLSAQ